MGAAPIPVWIGTAGYSWPDWVGRFYPPGTSAERMPGFYATQFPAVEVNSTFYRVPTVGQLTRLAGKTPPGFRFSLKVPRSISHEQQPYDIDPFRRAAEELTANGRLIGLLLQFPETFENTRPNRDWIDHVGAGLKPHDVWVEFRHRSWHRPRLGDWLRERGLELASVEIPALPHLFPAGLIDAGTTRVYARLHTRSADNWYGQGKVRYDFDYSDEALREWIGRLTEAAPRLDEVFLFFNNCQGVQGPTNARRMAVLLRAEAPQFRVVEPPGAPVPVQRGLFDE